MSIRKRLFFTYLVLIVLFILYSILTSYLGLLRNEMDSHIISIYKVKNTWNGIFISMNNILINWDNGKSYADFKAEGSAFTFEFEGLERKIRSYPFYPVVLKTHLKSLTRIWAEARNYLDKIRSAIENTDFTAAVDELKLKAGLQRLDPLLSDLMSSNGKGAGIKAHAVAQVINDIEFFPIYEKTFMRLYDTLIEKISNIHAFNIHLQDTISIGFFIAFLVTFFLSSLYFTKIISKIYYGIILLPKKTDDGYMNEIITIQSSPKNEPCRRIKGHYHLNRSFEIHCILKGEATYLLQKKENGNSNAGTETRYIKAKKGEWLIFPSDYKHTIFNPSIEEVNIFTFIEQDGVHEKEAMLRWEEPYNSQFKAKDAEELVRNGNIQMDHVEMLQESSPLDLFKNWLLEEKEQEKGKDKDKSLASLCTPLYNCIRHAGNYEKLQGFIEELKTHIHLQFFMINGTPDKAKVQVITSEGKILESDTVYDFAKEYKNLFEHMKKWLDPAIPIRIASSLDDSILNPRLKEFIDLAKTSAECKGIECRLVDNRVWRALYFMLNNYTKNFKDDGNTDNSEKTFVEELAKEVCYERSQSEKWFRKETSKTIIKFRLDLRIEKAKYELIYTNKAIKNITYDLGFYDQPDFTKKFKERTGYSPREYRRKYRV
jgi:AraC-like DNA-binding protein